MSENHKHHHHHHHAKEHLKILFAKNKGDMPDVCIQADTLLNAKIVEERVDHSKAAMVAYSNLLNASPAAGPNDLADGNKDVVVALIKLSDSLSDIKDDVSRVDNNYVKPLVAFKASIDAFNNDVLPGLALAPTDASLLASYASFQAGINQADAVADVMMDRRQNKALDEEVDDSISALNDWMAYGKLTTGMNPNVLQAKQNSVVAELQDVVSKSNDILSVDPDSTHQSMDYFKFIYQVNQAPAPLLTALAGNAPASSAALTLAASLLTALQGFDPNLDKIDRDLDFDDLLDRCVVGLDGNHHHHRGDHDGDEM